MLLFAISQSPQKLLKAVSSASLKVNSQIIVNRNHFNLKILNLHWASQLCKIFHNLSPQRSRAFLLFQFVIRWEDATSATVGKHAYKFNLHFSYILYIKEKSIMRLPHHRQCHTAANHQQQQQGSEERRKKNGTSTQPLTHNLIILLSNYFTALHHSQPTSIK